MWSVAWKWKVQNMSPGSLTKADEDPNKQTKENINTVKENTVRERLLILTGLRCCNEMQPGKVRFKCLWTHCHQQDTIHPSFFWVHQKEVSIEQYQAWFSKLKQTASKTTTSQHQASKMLDRNPLKAPLAFQWQDIPFLSPCAIWFWVINSMNPWKVWWCSGVGGWKLRGKRYTNPGIQLAWCISSNSCIFLSLQTLTCLWISTKKSSSYKIKYIYVQNRVYNSAWKYLHFLRFQDMNLKKSAISQACSWHPPFKGCMFDGWDYIIFLFKSLIANSHCPLLDDFREKKNVPLSLCFPRLWIFNRSHEQSKSKSSFLFPLPGPRYWSIPTRQIIVTSAKVTPNAGLREPRPPKNLKKNQL